MAAAAGYQVVEENLRAALRFFGTASGVGEVAQQDGLVLIDSGVGYHVFNIALLDGGVATIPELERRLAAAEFYYTRRGTRWSLWLCEDLLSPVIRRSVPGLIARSRLRHLTDAPGMIADRLAPPARALPEIECRPVTDAATRADFTHATSITFDIPFATGNRVYGVERAWTFDYHGYVGYWRGQAVSTAAIVPAAGALGVYSVGTLPQFRRKGYAEATMRHALARYPDMERSVLQSTRAGFAMYRAMGYRQAGHFTVYMAD